VPNQAKCNSSRERQIVKETHQKPTNLGWWYFHF
jgi:hypothetical protein